MFALRQPEMASPNNSRVETNHGSSTTRVMSSSSSCCVPNHELANWDTSQAWWRPWRYFVWLPYGFLCNSKTAVDNNKIEWRSRLRARNRLFPLGPGWIFGTSIMSYGFHFHCCRSGIVHCLWTAVLQMRYCVVWNVNGGWRNACVSMFRDGEIGWCA